MLASFISRTWENQAHTIASFYFKPERQYRFTAGQYADIILPHTGNGGAGLARIMTFSSNPDDPLMGFTTKFLPDRYGPYKEALLRLQPGDPVQITDAMGDMVLPLDSTTPLVFVAGGLGIASYISMVRWLLAHKDKRDITLLYAVRDISDMIFQDEFNRYAGIGNLRQLLYTTHHKAEVLRWDGEVVKQRLTSIDIIRYAGPDALIYISGGQQMVEQLVLELQSTYKLPQHRLAYDYYEGYPDADL